MTPTKTKMTRTQLQTTQPGKNVGVVYFKAESFFLVAESFFFRRSQKFSWRSHFFFGGDAYHKLTPTEIIMTPPQHITFQAEKKRLRPKKMAESFFFGTETNSSRAESYVVMWFRQCTICLRPKKS